MSAEAGRPEAGVRKRTAKQLVAVVGRPNVGKSTLFNRLIGQRLAITEDQPGTTRDRMYGDVEWNGKTFTLVDTGGLDVGAEGDIPERVQEQARIAIAEADVVVFLVDVQQGVMPGDEDAAQVLRMSRKPVLLVANKAESPNRDTLAAEFFALGMGAPLPVSAFHGMGTGDLLDAIVERLPAAPAPREDEEDATIRVAIIGRPNVGKSSLLNALLGQERVIVSDVPGTTRDSIDTLVTRDGTPYLFVDTAGIRRRGRIEPGVEKYSVMRALRAVSQCDVALLVLDAVDGITDNDLHIAGYVHDEAKGMVIVVNKWDAVEKDGKTADQFTKTLRQRMKFMDHAPVVYVSALTHQRVHRIYQEVQAVEAERERRVPTPELNSFAQRVQERHVASRHGKTLRIYYVTQPEIRPPTFVFFVNDPAIAHFGYLRFLENELRGSFGFQGTPIRISLRGRRERDVAR